jgi:hypothetical protein
LSLSALKWFDIGVLPSCQGVVRAEPGSAPLPSRPGAEVAPVLITGRRSGPPPRARQYSPVRGTPAGPPELDQLDTVHTGRAGPQRVFPVGREPLSRGLTRTGCSPDSKRGRARNIRYFPISAIKAGVMQAGSRCDDGQPRTTPLAPADKEKVGHANAERILRLKSWPSIAE